MVLVRNTFMNKKVEGKVQIINHHQTVRAEYIGVIGVGGIPPITRLVPKIQIFGNLGARLGDIWANATICHKLASLSRIMSCKHVADTMDPVRITR